MIGQGYHHRGISRVRQADQLWHMAGRTAFLLLVLLCSGLIHAQQQRLDSIERALKEHTGDGPARARTLAELGRTCSTISAPRALKALHEARDLAIRNGDDRLRTRVHVYERDLWALMMEYAKADSVGRLAATEAAQLRDPLLQGMSEVYFFSDENAFDSLQLATARDRIDRGLRRIRATNDRAALADALFIKSGTQVLNKDVGTLWQARDLFASLGDSCGVGKCLTYSWMYEPVASDPNAVRANFLRAMRLFREQGNICWQAYQSVNSVWAASDSADYAHALLNAQEAFDHAERFGAPELSAYCGNALAEMNFTLNADQEVLVHARKVLERSKERTVRGYAHIMKARLYLRLDQPDSTIAETGRWLQENPERGDHMNYGEIQCALGEALRLKGETVRALECLRTSYDIHHRYPHNYWEESLAALALGKLYAHADDAQLRTLRIAPAQAEVQALHYLERVLELGAAHGILKEQEQALHELSLLYERRGDQGTALRYLQRHAVMRDSVLDEDKTKSIALLQVRYETEKKEQEIALLGKDKEVQAKEIQKQKLVRNGFIGGFALVALFAGVFLVQRNRIGKEKKRSEELLLNILPEEVAEELKAKGEAEARHIDEVTVLFTDFKGFTAMSEVLSPKALVRDLHECFSAFDAICERYGLEKIKTIGDAYMAAGGLPVPNTTHATDAVGAALAMRDFIAEGKARKIAAGLPYFEVRIGIHTGPVVAGIVGVKKFQYDIWGDTVNTASRMESSGEVGKVNISEATYALLKETMKEKDVKDVVDGDNAQHATRQPATGPAFLFTPRGKVQAKGKGEMEMYFVEQRA